MPHFLAWAGLGHDCLGSRWQWVACAHVDGPAHDIAFNAAALLVLVERSVDEPVSDELQAAVLLLTGSVGARERARERAVGWRADAANRAIFAAEMFVMSLDHVFAVCELQQNQHRVKYVAKSRQSIYSIHWVWDDSTTDSTTESHTNTHTQGATAGAGGWPALTPPLPLS